MSDIQYKAILKYYGERTEILATCGSLLVLFKLLEEHIDLDKLNKLSKKSKIINSVARVEIQLKILKMILGLDDKLGAGILQSKKREKLINEIKEINEKAV